MLASIRRQQKGILIVVTAIIIIAFAWLYDSSSYDQLGQTDAFTVDGRTYRVSEARKLIRTFDLCRYLGTYEFLGAMAGRQNQDRTTYAVNLLVLRKQSQELGVRPAEDQIGAYIKDLPAFQAAGVYDPESFNRFTTDFLTPNGFSDFDLYQIIGDAISFSKIQELLGANLPPSPAVIDEAFEERFTEMTVGRMNLPKDSPPQKPTIADEAIKTHYDQNKAQYMSEPQRRAEYVLFQKPEPAEDEAEDVTKEKMKVYGQKVAEFARDVLAEAADFAALAKKHGADLQNSGNFSYDKPPAGLKDAPELLSGVFRSSLEIPISDPINTAKGYAIFNLLAVVEPQPLPLETATPKIRKELEDQAAAAALQAGATVRRTKLAAELTVGKPLKKAAAAAGLEVVDIPAFSRDAPPAGQPDSSLISAIASDLKKGELSEVLTGSDGAFLIYVKDKKLLSDDTVESKRELIAQSIKRVDAMLLFETWFNSAREASGVNFPAQVASQ